MGTGLKSRATLRRQQTEQDGSREMATVPLYPLRFTPILRRLIWGGRRLGTLLHKPIGDASDYAESWEISDYREAISVVENGPLAGSTIRELIQWYGPALLGRAQASRDQFPLLVKYIDAHQDLSVQVHPDDERGRRLAGDSGKTETWVILQAEPGSLIYAGLQPEVTRNQFADAIRSGKAEPLLHRVEPKPGDCILIESGTVHAIGAGVLLAEIQQTSDATFRVYDWGRVGPDGKPRPFISSRHWNPSTSNADRSSRSHHESSRLQATAAASTCHAHLTFRSSGSSFQDRRRWDNPIGSQS